MYERDYLMRLIQQLTVVLAKVLFNMELKQYDRAHAEIDTAFRSLLNLEAAQLYDISIEEIIAQLDTPDSSWQPFIVAAELLVQEAHISELNHEREAFIWEAYYKAVRLYVEGLQRAELSVIQMYEPKARRTVFQLDRLNSDEFHEERDSILETLENLKDNATLKSSDR